MVFYFVKMNLEKNHKIEIAEILKAQQNIKELVKKTPLIKMVNFSDRYESNIYFKREDLQRVRSYKIRGAFNKIKHLVETKNIEKIVCASAGNHAQGVALSCSFLNISGVIFMPITTPLQKIKQVEMFGKGNVEIKLIGDNFDTSFTIANEFCESHSYEFVHPFDDEKIISGQGTIALEILEQAENTIDYLFVPVGGGGLISGILSVFKEMSPQTKIIAVEPEGAQSLKTSLENNKNTSLRTIDKFIDGAAVKKIGDIAFEVCRAYLDDVVSIPEGKVCSTLLKLYNEKAIVVEPAGALSISSLDYYKDQIKGKNVVCVVSGGNNDISRMEEIKERSLLYEGLKHYFIVSFPQRAGALKEFVVNVLGENDDISFFEYTKKNSRTRSSAVVGIELKSKNDFNPLIKRMEEQGFLGEYLNDKPQLFQFLV